MVDNILFVSKFAFCMSAADTSHLSWIVLNTADKRLAEVIYTSVKEATAECGPTATVLLC